MIRKIWTFQENLIENFIFRYAIIVSIALHSGLIIQFSFWHPKIIPATFPKVEINYINVKFQAASTPEAAKSQRMIKAVHKHEKVLMPDPKTDIPSVKDLSKLNGEKLFTDKKPLQLPEAQMKHSVSIPVFKVEKINNPFYQNYYQSIRSVIRERAYANYSELGSGEVYLTFVILSDGRLKIVKLIPEKTTANDHLQKISLKSIQESNPFPPFPKDLTYPELTFNIVIAFELEN